MMNDDPGDEQAREAGHEALLGQLPHGTVVLTHSLEALQ